MDFRVFSNHKFIQGVSDEMYLFYFDIAFFWKSILNFRFLENNELICPFYACFLFLKILTLGKKFSPGMGFEPAPLWAKSESHTTRLWRSVSLGNFKRLTNFSVFFIETFKMSNRIEIWKKSDKIITNSFISLTITTIRHYFK